MTGADDDVVDLADDASGLGDLDRLFEQVLAGHAPAPDAPAWSGDLARLVQGARCEAAPAELATEGVVVARMVELRLAAGGGADAPSDARTTLVAPADPQVAPTAAPEASNGAAAEALPSAAAIDRPRLVPAGPYVPRHTRDYRAKHAAPRPPSSGSAARDVGRLIAVKAAAVTTAVVLGTVAAAAATTGIVANVVVPVITDTQDASPSPETTAPASAARGDGGDDDRVAVTVPVPECQLTPVCSPLTPASPTTDPVPSRPSGPTVPTTAAPAPTTTTTGSTTTTTVATATTGPGSTTTTTATEPPPTTAADPASTMSASESGAP